MTRWDHAEFTCDWCGRVQGVPLADAQSGLTPPDWCYAIERVGAELEARHFCSKEHRRLWREKRDATQPHRLDTPFPRQIRFEHWRDEPFPCKVYVQWGRMSSQLAFALAEPVRSNQPVTLHIQGYPMALVGTILSATVLSKAREQDAVCEVQAEICCDSMAAAE